MAFASPASLIELLLRQSDRHPIRAIGGADLQPYNSLLVRKLRNQGILKERSDLRDDGQSLFATDGDDLLSVDWGTGDTARYSDGISISSHDIDFRELCRAIREDSRLEGTNVKDLSLRVWRLGRHVRQERAIEICLVRGMRERLAQEIVDLARGSIDTESPIALVTLSNCELPTSLQRQLPLMRMAIVPFDQLLTGDTRMPFEMDFRRIRITAVPTSADARIMIDRIGRRIVIDKFELSVEPRDFGVFQILAEEAVDGGGWVSHDDLLSTLQARTQKDSNAEQVSKCIHRLRDAIRNHGARAGVTNDGFIKNKPKVGYRLDVPPADIGFLA